MNRRDWIKSFAALAIASKIPTKEASAFVSMALAVPVGYIFQMYGQNMSIVHVIKTDVGFEKLEGGELSKERFPMLHKVIGESFGKGSDETKFRLPDLRQIVEVVKEI